MTKDRIQPPELNTMDEHSRDEYFMKLAIEEGKKALQSCFLSKAESLLLLKYLQKAYDPGRTALPAC